MKSMARIVGIGIAITIPVLVALYGARNLAVRLFEANQFQLNRARTRAIRIESLSLANDLRANIESSKNLALRISDARHPELPQQGILAYAKLGPTLRLIRFKSGDRSVGRAQIVSAARKIDPKALAKTGMSIVFEAGGPVAFAISNPLSKKAPVLLVFLDSKVAFSGLQSWSREESDTRTSGRIVSSNGTVVADSRTAGLGTDISKTPLFRSELAPTFANLRDGGTTLVSRSRSAVMQVAYRRVEGTPFAAVVSRDQSNHLILPESFSRSAAESGVVLLAALLLSMGAVMKLAPTLQSSSEASPPLFRMEELDASISDLNAIHSIKEAEVASAAHLHEAITSGIEQSRAEENLAADPVPVASDQEAAETEPSVT